VPCTTGRKSFPRESGVRRVPTRASRAGEPSVASRASRRALRLAAFHDEDGDRKLRTVLGIPERDTASPTTRGPATSAPPSSPPPLFDFDGTTTRVDRRDPLPLRRRAATVCAAATEEPRRRWPTPAPLCTTSHSVTLEGAHTTLGAYRGQVLLIVNVAASRCGFTPQYAWARGAPAPVLAARVHRPRLPLQPVRRAGAGDAAENPRVLHP
jgi:hypothetical protein